MNRLPTGFDVLPFLSRAGLFAIALLLSAFPTLPANLVLPGGGLDPSWSYALNRAFDLNKSFSQDIAFTHGPLALLATREFSPESFPYLLWLSVLLWIALSLAVYAWFRRGLYLPVLASLALQLVFSPYVSEYLPISVAFFIAITVVRGYLSNPLLISLLWLAVTPFAFSKGTLFIFWGAGTAILSIWLLASKKRPVFFSLFLVSQTIFLIIVWSLTGYPIGEMAPAIRNVLYSVVGYSEAMSIPGPSWQVLLAILASLGIIAGHWWLNKSENVGNTLVELLFMALILFLGFKTGFVRHDNHVFSFLFVLAIVAIVCSTALPIRQITLGAATSAGIITGLLIGEIFVPQFSMSSLAARVTQQTTELVRLATDSKGFQRDYEQRFSESTRALEDEYRISSYCDGAVDVIPSETAAVASLPSWNPRPTFQSYSVYNRQFQLGNLAHIVSLPIGSRLIVNPDSIDGRLPLSDEPGLWWEFASNYRVINDGPLGLCLEKKSSHRLRAIQSAQVSASFGEEVSFAEDNRAILGIDIRVEKTLLGRVWSFVYKPTQLRIELVEDDGSTHNYRLVPTPKASLTPVLINNTDELNSWLNQGVGERRIVSVSVYPGVDGLNVWKPEFTVDVLLGDEPNQS